MFQLSTIMDLLEGAFYGMDLLKLHSVTTKLLERVDNIEKVSELYIYSALHIFIYYTLNDKSIN